jgi:AcrR family transcriptional regulator
MRLCGSADVRLSDVARDMRMSAPGLYRYFDGRDGLLTALITDAFTDLAVSVEHARDGVPVDDAGGRYLAVAEAYRRWALEHREQFSLIFGPPVSGYQAPADGSTHAAAKRAMQALRRLITDAEEVGVRKPPRLTELPQVLRDALTGGDMDCADPATELALVNLWASLHGFITLETFGMLDWHGPEVQDAMFLGLVRVLGEAAGLPEPTAGWPPTTPA